MTINQKTRTKITPDWIRVNDQYIAALIKSLKSKSVYSIDKTLITELDEYLKVTRNLKGESTKIPYGIHGKDDLAKIGMFFSKTQKYKERVYEIQIRFLEFLQPVNQLKKKAEMYILENYESELAHLKPAARQQFFLDTVLVEVQDLLSDASLIKEKSEIVLKNLTDTYWTLSKVEEIALAFINSSLLKHTV